MALLATLTSGQSSDVFSPKNDGDTKITMIGTFNSATIALHVSDDPTTGFVQLYADGSPVSFSTTGESRSFQLHEGLFYKFVASTVTSVKIYKTFAADR